MKDITRIGDASSKLEVSHFLVTKVRPRILDKLEGLRSEKKIGKALEASVLWELPDLDFVTMVMSGWSQSQLAEVFGVSQVHIFATNEAERLDVYSLVDR